jgi:hypothetical protein
MADPDLRALARFLPEFERADFSAGSWTDMRKQEDGVYTMPYATLSPVASDFVQAAYDAGWVLQDFDWPEWKDTEEAKALYRDPDLLAQATPHQLAQLLTVFIRQDRFVEGGLLGDFKSGHILAMVRRAAKLLEASEAGSKP